MSVKPILQLGNLTLLEKSQKVDDITSQETKNIITDLKDTLPDFRLKNGFGRGIAAPQIGILKRIIYIDIEKVFTGTLINPEIVWVDDRHQELWDSCFSFSHVLVRVQRARQITVKYLNENDMPRTLDAEGDMAELLQHEIDHIDGVLAVQRVVSPDAFITRIEWENQGRPA